MRFISLSLHNFLSYGSPEQTLQLDRKGLVAVMGSNQDSPGADSNGSGKSSLMEALVWALYGVTMRGYKGDEVINRTTKKNCYVRLEMEDDGHNYVVIRSRKTGARRNSDLQLEVDGQDATQGTLADTQALIQTIVGMDFKTFTQSVMLWHGTKPFSRMSDSEQKAVLEDILRIDQLSKAKVVVKDRISARQASFTAAQNKLEALDSRIADEHTALNKFKHQSGEFHNTIALKRKDLSRGQLAIYVKIEEIHTNTGLDKLLKTREDLKRIEEELGKRRMDVQKEKLQVTRSFATKRNALSKREGQVQGQLNQIARQIRGMDQLAGTQCPTCSQSVAVEFASAFVERLEKMSELLRSQEIEALQKAHTVIEQDEHKDLSALANRESAIEKEWSETQARLQITNEQIRKRENSLHLICQLEQQAWSLQQESQELESTVNPYETLIKETEESLKDLGRERRRISYRLKALDIELKHLVYWNHGFGNQGLKSYILDHVVPFLTERANEYADILSGGSIEVAFSTRTQLKDGTFREKFQVQAFNKQGADVYHGNSDGERRRIDIAVGWALADLAATRAEKPIHFRGLDEPFEHLDVTGEDLVIKLLHKVLPQYETVMCVTHSTHLRDQFPEEIVVNFENGFSNICRNPG